MIEKAKRQFAYFVYNILLYIIAPLFFIKLYKKRDGVPNIGSRWREHFGSTSLDLSLFKQNSPIWFHAVSVGELLTLIPLIKELHHKDRSMPILITTTTTTGQAQAQLFIDSIDSLKEVSQHHYLPLDFPWAIKRFLKYLMVNTEPRLLIIMETELWPNLLLSLKRKEVPIVIVNARLSERSANGYQKLRWLCDCFIPCVDQVLAQSESDMRQFKRIGFSEQQISITGSLKFDIIFEAPIQNEIMQLRESLIAYKTVILIASTHQGEDELLLPYLKEILIQNPNTLFIIVPRHPERFHIVKKLAIKHGFSVQNRTTLSFKEQKIALEPSTNLLIGDSMGEMLCYISISDFVIMGGSFIGDKVGGHNLLEPAYLGKASLIGPSYYNFKEITQAFVKGDATIICNSLDDLSSHINELIITPEKALIMGKKGLELLQRNKGATNHTMDYLVKHYFMSDVK